MSVVNLAEDFMRRFSIRSSVYEPKPEPAAPIDPISTTPEDRTIDIVSNTPTPDKTPIITPDVWQTNIEASTITPSEAVNNIKTPTKRLINPPVLIGNRQFRSAGTANWASIRKSVYPLYKNYCLANNTIPSIHEFSSLIGPRWKALSQEDKAKACADPSSYFTF